MLDEGVEPAQIQQLLRLRQATIAREHEVATARLAEVERRLRRIGEEQDMTEVEIITKPLPALRLAAQTALVEEPSEVVELPSAELGACAVRLGEMSRIRETWEALHRGLAARGLQASGPARELYVRAAPEHDQSAWVTELQIPVAPR